MKQIFSSISFQFSFKNNLIGKKEKNLGTIKRYLISNPLFNHCEKIIQTQFKLSTLNDYILEINLKMEKDVLKLSIYSKHFFEMF